MWLLTIIVLASSVISNGVDSSELPTCPDNEHWLDCVAGQCFSKLCSDLGKSLGCPFVIGSCPGGCLCIHGYLRNNEGVCIPQENCPNTCRANEKTGYTAPCEVVSCEQLENPPKCTPESVQNLESHFSCLCEDGYLRDYNGDCIKKEQCKIIKCLDGEILASCGVECPRNYCPASDAPPPECDQVYPCDAGCVCTFNHRRNQDNKCILASECPPVNCTRPNEVYDSCPSACLRESCADKDNQPSTCNTLLLNCNPDCICKKNHFRNDNFICVPADECHPVRVTRTFNGYFIDFNYFNFSACAGGFCFARLQLKVTAHLHNSLNECQ